ncbi:MAG: polymerase delta-prime subunit [Pseudomonadota bacterium]
MSIAWVERHGQGEVTRPRPCPRLRRMLVRLSQIRGHAAQLDALRRLLRGARPAHALLLVGPEGVGKTTVAEALAASLACLERRPDGDPCGACRSCHALERGDHPDVQRLARDGQGIKIDQVRDATRVMRFEPVLGAAKTLIIEEADRLREEAANALLKTLEEPPRDTYFLLVSSRPQLLIDTIRSRCQSLRLGPLGQADIEAILRAEGRDPALASLGASLADGSLTAARTRAEPSWRPVLEALIGFGTGLGSHRLGVEVGFVEELAGLLDAVESGGESKAKGRSRGPSREGLQWTIDALRALLRDALLVAAGVDPETLPHAPWAAGLRQLAERAGAEGIGAGLEALDETDASLVLNPSTALTLEHVLVELGAACAYGGAPR